MIINVQEPSIQILNRFLFINFFYTLCSPTLRGRAPLNVSQLFLFLSKGRYIYIYIYKIKISVPIWNDELDLPDGSYSISEIQDHFEFIIKKHNTLAENPPIQIYPNKIKSRIVFKIKTGYQDIIYRTVISRNN